MFGKNTANLARWIWLIFILVLPVLVWLKAPTIDTSMMSLLPNSQQQPLVREASSQIGQQFSQRLLILVSSTNHAALKPAVTNIATKFQQLSQIESVTWQVDLEQIKQTQDDLFQYRYTLLADEVSDVLESQQTELVREQALSRIINPLSFGSTNLKADPFGLFPAWQISQTPTLNVVMDDGFMRLADDNDTYLLILNLKADAFAMETQQAVLTQYQQLESDLTQQQFNFTPSGLLIHANAGAKQAQKEISTIGLGSLIGIVVLMLWIFRRISTVLILILPVTVGCIVATSVAFLTFERVHIVTFAFGAGLIGVAIDYSLHFLCERHKHKAVLAYILPGLLLGLLSSVLAYAAQAITPFPGLRQMAVFSVVGLIAAWLTVLLWLPVLTNKQNFKELQAAKQLIKWQSYFPTMTNNRWLMGGVTTLGLVSLLIIFNGNAEDDLRLLQTSPTALLEQEKEVQKLLGLKSSTQFLLIPCADMQRCLEKEELVKPELEQLVMNGVLDEYQLVSDRLPSVAQQEKNAEKVATLYAKELSALYKALNIPEQTKRQAIKIMQTESVNRLTLHDEAAKQLTDNVAAQIITTTRYGMATVVGLSSQQTVNNAQLDAVFHQVPDMVMVDQVAAISGLLKNYREQVMLWVAIAYLFVFVMLTVRYKAAVIRIITPPVLASVYTLAVLILCLPGINLFHMMALILVLGIGIDMGIFLTETKQAAQTWLAVTLSIMTSLIAFGLLALSATPVLKHFGLTVLLGLSFVWLLATLFRQTNSGSSQRA